MSKSRSNYWDQVSRRRISRRRLLHTSGVAGAGIAGLTILGCGNDDDEATPAPGNGEEPTPAASNGTEPAPSNGGHVRIGIGQEPTTVDASEAVGGGDNQYINQIYSGLYQYDPSGGIEPDLAESYEMTPDGMQVTFTLRPGVVFHNGDPFTAEDVVYTLERARSDETAISPAAFETIAEAEAVDDHTLVYRMMRPDASFEMGNFGEMFIVPKGYTESVGPDEFGRNPVGTGAYRFTSRTIGTGIAFERFEDHYRGPAAFATAEILIAPDATSRVQMFQTGELDVATQVPVAQLETVRSVNGGQIVTQAQGTEFFYAFGLKEKEGGMTEAQQYTTDRRVRQALNYAVDNRGISEAVYGELGVPYWVTNEDQPFHLDQSYEYDPDRARELLSEAGADGMPMVQYNLGGDRFPGLAPMSAAIASNLRDVGVNVDERTEEYDAWLGRFYDTRPNHPHEGMIFATGGTGRLMQVFLGWDQKYSCDGALSHVCDPELDDLMVSASEMFDEEERNETLRTAMQLIFDEAYAIWVALLEDAYAVQTSVVANWEPRSGRNVLFKIEDFGAA